MPDTLAVRAQTEPRRYHGVMVSSTFVDLEKYRAVLHRAMDGEGLRPVSMEDDSAKPDVDVIESSLQMVSDSSAYVGIIAGWYGQIPHCPTRNPRQVSITELEFDHAQSLRRPIILFIADETHLARGKYRELDADKLRKLDAFRERAKRMRPGSQVHRVYATFGSLREFERKAIHAVAGLRRYFDRHDSKTEQTAREYLAVQTKGAGLPIEVVVRGLMPTAMEIHVDGMLLARGTRQWTAAVADGLRALRSPRWSVQGSLRRGNRYVTVKADFVTTVWNQYVEVFVDGKKVTPKPKDLS